MTQGELWQALDDLASGDAPRVPTSRDLVVPATRLRRRRAVVRTTASIAGAVVATVVALLTPSLFVTQGAPDEGPSFAATSGPPTAGVTPVVPPSSKPSASAVRRSPAPSSPAWTQPAAPPSAGSSAGSSVRIDAGGRAVGSFVADDGAAGGKVVDYPQRPVTTVGVRSPAPVRVYQSCRYGPRLRYRISGLAPAGRYMVRLHWAELDFEAPGQRVFAVAVNGVTVLPRMDIVALTGARWRALVRELPATAAADGAITVTLTRAGPDNPFLNALEVLPATGR